MGSFHMRNFQLRADRRGEQKGPQTGNDLFHAWLLRRILTRSANERSQRLRLRDNLTHVTGSSQALFSIAMKLPASPAPATISHHIGYCYRRSWQLRLHCHLILNQALNFD
jgi:hypothetical protein